MAVETRLFDDGILSGIRSWFHYDHADDTAHIQTEVNARELVAETKAQFNAVDKGARPFSGLMDQPMVKVASLPLTIFVAWQKEGLFRADRKQDLFRRLNDPDNRAFRTHPGKL